MTEPTLIKSVTRGKKYDPNFKREVLEHWRTSGKTAAEVATAFGVSTFSLYTWRKKGEALPVGGAGNAASRTLETVEAENVALRRELAHVREQRDILKKTLGIVCDAPVTATYPHGDPPSGEQLMALA